MQKLRNTVIVMSAGMLVMAAGIFALTYTVVTRGGAMLDKMQQLESRLDEYQVKLSQAQPSPIIVEKTIVERQASLPPAPAQDEVIIPASIVQKFQNTNVAQLAKLAGLLKTDPTRGLQDLRKQIQLLDREARLGSRFLIAEGIKTIERGVEPRQVEAELRNYFGDRDNSTYLRALAAGRLAQRGDASAIQDLLKEVARGPLQSANAVERLEAVVNIASTESPVATPYLLSMLGDPDFIVRTRATEGLGFTGGEDATAALVQLQNDPTPAVRDAAKRATERMQSAWLRN